MNVSSRTSITRSITMVSIIVIFLTMAGAGAYQYHRERIRYVESMNATALLVLDKIGATVTDPFWKYSVAGFERALSYELMANDFLAIIVDDRQKANTFSQEHFYLGKIKGADSRLTDYADTEAQRGILAASFIKHEKVIRPGTGTEVVITVYLTRTFLDRHLNGIVLNILLVAFATSLMILLATSLTLNRIVTRPINRFVLTGLDLIKGGVFDAPIPIVRQDEIGRLTEGINRMADELRKTYDRLSEQNRDLENRVQERTLQLANTNDALVKANEELTAARDKAWEGSRMKSAFLANMSHELRTPMNAILLYADLLAEEAEEHGHEQSVQDLAKIKQAGKHLLALIEEILDLSKIEAGKILLHIEETNVQETLEEISDNIALMVAKNRNTLVLETDPEAGTMRTDQTRLRQILLNLIGNASKFTNNGTITLGVTPDVEAGFLHFFVRDTGIGMSPEQQTRIFQEFTQADESTTKRFGGTGLGLTLSQRFTELLGGKIWVESEEGRGSTFHVLLPRNGAAASPARSLPAGSRSARGRVLLIEDDELLRDAMARTLTKEGFEVHSAPDGEKGLEMATALHPQLITLDMLLPGMDGWQVLGRLKERPELRPIPVVIVTQLDEERCHGFATGALAFLQKPVSSEELISTASHILGRTEGNSVLVIEDDAPTREGLLRVLEKDGRITRGAGNGLEALEALRRGERPALMLLDLMMPEMDGFQFLAEIQAHADWNDIPIVVLTAKKLTPGDLERLKVTNIQRLYRKGSTSREDLAEVVGALATHWSMSSSRHA